MVAVKTKLQNNDELDRFENTCESVKQIPIRAITKILEFSLIFVDISTGAISKQTTSTQGSSSKVTVIEYILPRGGTCYACLCRPNLVWNPVCIVKNVLWHFALMIDADLWQFS